MNCDSAKAQLPDWLNDELSITERTALDAHLAQCPACRQELAATRQVWQLMGAVSTPEPRPEMRTQFYAMLHSFDEAEQADQETSWAKGWERFRQLWTPRLAGQVAFSILLLSIGLVAGYWMQDRRSANVAYQQRIDTLSTQVQEMREMMMLSLLENPSATERLRAVGYTKDLNDANGRVIDALLTTLNNDPNVNVRLVTLEALAELAHDPRAREGLVQSLTKQESPLVQVALADVMLKLQEKRSLKPLRQMLRQEGVNDLVKIKIE
ncbi:MAG TPA: zf-HC2 domain-containing protein, partial [Spirosoma sp.]|nr:zf-HC2 domain-containing protein [Spirosoma sp.]